MWCMRLVRACAWSCRCQHEHKVCRRSNTCWNCLVFEELAGQVASEAGPPPVDCFMTELSGLLECPQVRRWAHPWS